jgi:FtsP/CotA-like multicopper oxidase with cupredoxin domain
MPSRPTLLAVAPLAAAVILAPSGTGGEADWFWGVLCGVRPGAPVSRTALQRAAALPTAHCAPAPTGFEELPSVGTGGDTKVSLDIGYDPDTNRLCYVATGLPEAPVLRVGVGHALSIELTNTLHDTGTHDETNCPIDVFGGEGLCVPLPHFEEAPGPDGPYYPLMANEAHVADGTSNLHVHGLFVSPQPCSDEVLKSAIYPANWSGPVALTPGCQGSFNSLTYTYRLPANHPAGLYWYHTHRHGEAEQETQMGLAGAIVVEDEGDAYRRSIGVTDEVLLIDDTPKKGCLIGVQCDVRPHRPSAADRASRLAVQREARHAAARAVAASWTIPSASTKGPILDPRIDQADQAGECAQGAVNEAGGIELWTLTVNGAPVPEALNGSFPADSELLAKTMQPGQRQIFRMVNASADSFVAPKLVLVQNGVETFPELEVFARDGVGASDAQGNRHFVRVDTARSSFVVPPSGRVEFVVHAPPVGATLYLQSDPVYPGCGGNAYPARRLLRITAAGSAVAPGPADDHDLLLHTPSLAPYLSTLGATPSVHRTIVLAEYTRAFTYGVTKWLTGPPTTADYNPGQTDFYIPEVASDDGEVVSSKTTVQPFVAGSLAPQIVVHLRGKNSVTEEWLVENSTLEIHAFHMHQIHFRDVTVPSTDPDKQPMLDVITVPAAPLIGNVATGYPGAPGWVRLRMTFTKADIGEFVFHCHILEHEDNGMMGKIAVVAD